MLFRIRHFFSEKGQWMKRWSSGSMFPKPFAEMICDRLKSRISPILQIISNDAFNYPCHLDVSNSHTIRPFYLYTCTFLATITALSLYVCFSLTSYGSKRTSSGTVSLTISYRTSIILEGEIPLLLIAFVI
jgi:hypothetical protein